MADKKSGAEQPKARQKPKAAPAEVSRTVTYLPPGRRPAVQRADFTVDDALVEVREREAAANAEVKVRPREEPSIAPEVAKARDEQVKRETERAKK